GELITPPEPRIERPPRVLAPVVLVEPQARRDLKAAERHLGFGEFAPQLSRLHAREDVALGDRDAQVAELDRGLDVEAVGSAIELEVGPGAHFQPAARFPAQVAAEFAGQDGDVARLRLGERAGARAFAAERL